MKEITLNNKIKVNNTYVGKCCGISINNKWNRIKLNNWQIKKY